MIRNITIRPFSIMGMPEQAKLAVFADTNSYLEAKQLNHQIAHRFSFEHLIEAHQSVEASQVHGVVLVTEQDSQNPNVACPDCDLTLSGL